MIVLTCVLVLVAYLAWNQRYRIKDAWFNFRMRCQRFVKGYADVDVWNMDESFKIRTVAMLKDLRKYHHGFPGTKEVPTDEKWCEILDRMIFCFEESLEDTECSIINPYREEYNEALNRVIRQKGDVLEEFVNKHPCCEHEKEYFEYEKKIWKYKKKMQDEGLELFCKYFNNLWD